MVRQEIKDEVEFWSPEKIGDKLTGKLIGSFNGKFGPVFKLQAQDGKIYGTPSHNILQSKMGQVPLGANVEIELTEIKDTDKGNPMRLYKVVFDDGQ